MKRSITFALAACAALSGCAHGRKGGGEPGLPRDPEVLARYQRGVDLLGAGQYGTAVGELKEVVAREPSAASSHYELAWALFHGGEYLQALTEFGTVVRAVPGHSGARLGVGVCAYALGLHAQAVEHLERCVSNAGGPRWAADCALLQAMALMRAGRPGDADALLAELTGWRGLLTGRMWVDPQSAQITGRWKVIGEYLRGSLPEDELMGQAWATPEQALFAWYASATVALVRGDAAQAGPRLAKLAQLPPGSPPSVSWIRQLARADRAALAPPSTGL